MGTLSFVRRHSTLIAFTVSLGASACFVACGSDSNGGEPPAEAGTGGAGNGGSGTTGGSSGNAGKAGGGGNAGKAGGGGGGAAGAAGSAGKAGSAGAAGGGSGGKPPIEAGPDAPSSNGDAASDATPDGN